MDHQRHNNHWFTINTTILFLNQKSPNLNMNLKIVQWPNKEIGKIQLGKHATFKTQH